MKDIVKVMEDDADRKEREEAMAQKNREIAWFARVLDQTGMPEGYSIEVKHGEETVETIPLESMPVDGSDNDLVMMVVRYAVLAHEFGGTVMMGTDEEFSKLVPLGDDPDSPTSSKEMGEQRKSLQHQMQVAARLHQLLGRSPHSDELEEAEGGKLASGSDPRAFNYL